MSGPRRVVVLSGGPSREHDISRKTGDAVAKALASLGHRVLPVSIARDGRWSLPAPAARALPQEAAPAAALAALASGAGDGAPEAVFVALHGSFGEDGTVQGFLETAGIPYTGSAVAASALAMDKERTKEVLSHHGIATAPWASTDRERWEAAREREADRLEAVAGLPCVVKMPREGSSFGVTIASDRATLLRAVGEAVAAEDGRALVERRIAGTEVTCPVLGNRGAPLRTLPLVEIVPKGKEFFDFAAKYEGASAEICPARVPEAVAVRVREDAMTAHRVLGCDGLSRSDFIVDEEGTPWFLETNTVPGMTEQSLCPLSARTAGISFPELCALVLDLALARPQKELKSRA